MKILPMYSSKHYCRIIVFKIKGKIKFACYLTYVTEKDTHVEVNVSMSEHGEVKLRELSGKTWKRPGPCMALTVPQRTGGRHLGASEQPGGMGTVLGRATQTDGGREKELIKWERHLERQQALERSALKCL